MIHEPNKLHSIIGDKIRLARLEMKLSQKNFAKKLEKSTTTINRWERGASAPDLNTILNLAEMTHKSIEFFFTNTIDDNQVFLESIIKDKKIDSEEELGGLFKNLYEISPRKRALVARMLNKLLLSCKAGCDNHTENINSKIV